VGDGERVSGDAGGGEGGGFLAGEGSARLSPVDDFADGTAYFPEFLISDFSRQSANDAAMGGDQAVWQQETLSRQHAG
jgi:hypothetical protein